jgi:inorganic triphosphatase YgiF
MSHELELKFVLPPERVPQLERALGLLGKDVAGPKRVKRLVSTYFDTDARTLRSQGISFSIRSDGKQRLQTVKWTQRSDFFDRGESETEIDGTEPDWKAVRGTPLKPLVGKELRRSLKPLFETRVRRTIYPIVIPGAEIELAVDNGSIHAGRRSAPVRELELEVKRGETPNCFASRTSSARGCRFA